MVKVDENETTTKTDVVAGIRIVITLKKSIIVSGGNGTEINPYILDN